LSKKPAGRETTRKTKAKLPTVGFRKGKKVVQGKGSKNKEKTKEPHGLGMSESPRARSWAANGEKKKKK